MALHGSSHDPVATGTPKAPRQKQTDWFFLLLLVFGLALLLMLVPGVRGRLTRMFSGSVAARMNPGVVVWVKRQAGTYYCEGTRMYGSAPGSYMEQGEALTEGYQPEFGQYCKETQAKESRGHNGKANRSSRKVAVTPRRPSSESPATK
ncbi:MAG TPA: hypothetical protein VNJ52_02775 [Patescibacteria group bacterium]|nr:hypothetical protein [Patescibacteria group bacterium]